MEAALTADYLLLATYSLLCTTYYLLLLNHWPSQTRPATGYRLPATGGGSVERAQLQQLADALTEGAALHLLQRVPHLVLLSLPFYHSKLKPLLAALLLGWLRRQGLVDVTDEQARGLALI